MQDRDEPALRRRGDWTVVVILAILGAAIFAAGVVVGISLDGQDPDKLGLEVAKALMTLGSGLILGGAVKAVLDRFQEAARDRAEEEVRQAHQFDEEQSRHERLLADLRGVHDSAESVRLMVAAHRSAKAYGEHMRALIGCQVLLLKVKRTLDVSQEHGPEAVRINA